MKCEQTSYALLTACQRRSLWCVNESLKWPTDLPFYSVKWCSAQRGFQLLQEGCSKWRRYMRHPKNGCGKSYLSLAIVQCHLIFSHLQQLQYPHADCTSDRQSDVQHSSASWKKRAPVLIASWKTALMGCEVCVESPQHTPNWCSYISNLWTGALLPSSTAAAMTFAYQLEATETSEGGGTSSSVALFREPTVEQWRKLLLAMKNTFKHPQRGSKFGCIFLASSACSL